MKIDIHVHTKKVKSGDPETRNISKDKFADIIKDSEVGILAITNHNHFDLCQYNEFRESVESICQVWPGVELDILENGKRAHLLVICNPINSKLFSDAIDKAIGTTSVEDFGLSIVDTVNIFDSLDCIYIAHYFAKKPDLGDEELSQLEKLISNPKRLLKEATNSISAGIYISHGHNSIYGSDIQDWNKYSIISKSLPELRLPVESFEQFCLLLEKDEATIDTALNKKTKINVEIAPISVAELIHLDVYDDINILFGSKGTGKTKILEALSNYFNSKGYKTKVYKSNNTHLNAVYNINGSSFDCDVQDFEIDNCDEEINLIRTITEVEVTSLSKYRQHYSEKETNRISQTLKIKNINKLDESSPKRKLTEISNALNKFKEFNHYIENNQCLKDNLDTELTTSLSLILSKVIDKLTSETEDKLISSKSAVLLNQIVDVFLEQIAKKTGKPIKPTETGFAKYAQTRLSIEVATNKILTNIAMKIPPKDEYVGSLGDKGQLFCRTNIVIQNGTIHDSSFSQVKSVDKTPPKKFVEAISSISKHIYSNDLFEKISSLNQIPDIDTICGLNELLLKYKHFIINGELYKPSDGESSMLLLHKELLEDKEIYLIDEPEKSLGNDYINDVIVPLLKEKALLNKKVIIATHDANIAVRTLPYNSIYRLHDKNQYFTLTGNPFTNLLKCVHNTREPLEWKEISMKTLEGGREAFGERGKIYGN